MMKIQMRLQILMILRIQKPDFRNFAYCIQKLLQKFRNQRMRISLVNSIGSAVMGFFVGGGGLGYVLYRGIRTMNFNFILQGTLTLMAMAIVVDAVMSYYEHKLLPKNQRGV